MTCDDTKKQISNGLVTIGSSKKGTAPEGGVTRRNFLKILGATTAVGMAGCADDKKSSILPMVKGEPEQIPGVSVWYRTTCTECAAACGVMVRTREGRAVKVEGNPESPINQGGLCALGQASLQNLYDPDRVRQPISRNRDADRSGRAIYKHVPIGSWDEGYAKVADALKDGSKKKALVTGELSGSLATLVSDFCAALGVTHVTWDPMQPVALAKASEIVYGSFGIPNYNFEKAEVVVNFGADFLETWVSPVQYARGWAKSRKSSSPIRVVHIEPRLSLSGANADLWLAPNPGSEISFALYLIKKLLASGKGSKLSASARAQAEKLSKDASIEAAVEATGIAKEKLLLVVQYLTDAESSLVIAGGTAAATADPLPLQVAAALLNLMLGNVGKTVDVSSMRTPNTDIGEMQKLIEGLKAGEYSTLLVYETNPSFTLPGSYGFELGRNMTRLAVSFSSHLDETASSCDLVLPSHTGLESWGDARPFAGVHGLLQPSMRPVFDTKNFGDSLLAIAEKAGKGEVAGGAKSFEEYLKASWKKLHATLSGTEPDFNKFWLKSLERGGYFAVKENGSAAITTKDSALVGLKFESAQIEGLAAEVHDDHGHGESGHGAAAKPAVLFPYFSVRTFDGRAANRPWLQELPDPVTTAVWDSWVEMHPDTAAGYGIHKDDLVTLRNKSGEVNVGVYLTPYIKKGVVALPIGQGHTAYGRYAKENSDNGNVYSLLPALSGAEAAAGAVALLSTTVTVERARGKASLLIVQGSDTQEARGLGKTDIMALGERERTGHGSEPTLVKEIGEGGGHGEEEHHQIKQMYDQREHPLYRWGMAIDLASCTGCGACVVACSAENNIAFVGKKQVYKGREMSWLRIERYYDGGADELAVSFVPMMCQQCGNAPCEPVCPVYATYHNEEGLNAMIYNRCVGTRYCSNNCVYKVRRFNWYEYEFPEPLNWQLNPDVTKRGLGVMEKCTFCVQRIAEGKDRAKDLGRLVEDGEIQPACAQSCPTECITFGNLNDPQSAVSKKAKGERGYKILDKWLNTQPAITYLKRVKLEA